jgi:hypothetical protein
MKILINGVDKTSLFSPYSLSIQDEISARSTADFSLVDKTGNYHPSPGQPIEVYDNSNNLIFGGMIEEPEEENPMSTNVLYIPITCIDQQAIADRYLYAESHDNQTCGYIVRDILSKKLAQEGVIEGIIHDGSAVVRAVFPYLKVTQCLDDLAELAGFSWWISHDKKLYFVSRETFKAPFNITSTSKIRNVKVKTNKDRYRNRQFIRAGHDVTDIQTERFKGDGEQRTFSVGFKIANKPTIKVNGVTQSVGIRGVDEGSQWYWSKGEKEITQDDSEIKLTSSDTLEIVYQGFFPILVVAEDGSAITERKKVEGGSGIYESMDQQASIDNADAALDIAQGKLRRFARLNRFVEFETDLTGLQAGQIIQIDLPIHNIKNAEFLIQSVSISDYTPDGDLRYHVSCVDGEAVGGWAQFFKTLINQGGTFTIRENEVLVKLKSSRDTVHSKDTLTISKASPESRIGYAMIGFSEVG